jgi:hypothetical protein
MNKKFNIKEWQQKHLLKEHALGELPSDKLIKMKQNPVKEDLARLKEYGEDEFNRSADMYKDTHQYSEPGFDADEISFDNFMKNLIGSDVDKDEVLEFITNALVAGMAKTEDLYDLQQDLMQQFELTLDGTE